MTAAGPRTLQADVEASVVSSPNVIAPRTIRGTLAVVMFGLLVVGEVGLSCCKMDLMKKKIWERKGIDCPLFYTIRGGGRIFLCVKRSLTKIVARHACCLHCCSFAIFR